MRSAVVTRDPGRAAPYLDALAAIGVPALAMPVTTSAPPLDGAALAQAARAMAPGDVVALTSVNAVAAIVAAAAGQGRTLDGLELWAVGEATGAALRNHCLDATVAVDATGAGLATAMIERGVAGRRIWLPRAEHGRDELALALDAAGASVASVIAYRTVALAADDPALVPGLSRLRAGEVAAFVVFAPSQVDALEHVLQRAGAPALASFAAVAIGPTTASALGARGVTHLEVAVAPAPVAVANAVTRVYRWGP